MYRCPDCSFSARRPLDLLEHRRATHPDSQGANRAAFEKTVAALGDVDDKDAARVEALRSMADALDIDPLNAQMWKEYRASLDILTPRGADDSDEATRILAALAGATPVVHTSKN